MSLIRPTQLTIAFAMLLFPTIVISDSIDFYYAGEVELVMLNPATANFRCAANSLPAEIEIDDGMYNDFPPSSSADTPDRAPIRIRRGVELEPHQDYRTAAASRASGWGLDIRANINICVGPMTLQIMHGRLDVFGLTEPNERQILGSYDVLQDMHIRYDVHRIFPKQIRLSYTTDGNDEYWDQRPLTSSQAESLPTFAAKILGDRHAVTDLTSLVAILVLGRTRAVSE